MKDHPDYSMLELILMFVLYKHFQESGLGLRAEVARYKVQRALQLSDNLIEVWSIRNYDFYYYLRQTKRVLQDKYHLIASPKHGYWTITPKGIDRIEKLKFMHSWLSQICIY